MPRDRIVATSPDLNPRRQSHDNAASYRTVSIILAVLSRIWDIGDMLTKPVTTVFFLWLAIFDANASVPSPATFDQMSSCEKFVALCVYPVYGVVMWGGVESAVTTDGAGLVPSASVCGQLTVQMIKLTDAGLDPSDVCAAGIELLAPAGIDRTLIDLQWKGKVGETCHNKCLDTAMGKPLRLCMQELASQAVGTSPRDPTTGPKCERIAASRERQRGKVNSQNLFQSCATICYSSPSPLPDTAPVPGNESAPRRSDTKSPWLGDEYCRKVQDACDKNQSNAKDAEGIESVVREEISGVCGRTWKRLEGLSREGASPGILAGNVHKTCGEIANSIATIQAQLPERIPSGIGPQSPTDGPARDGSVDGPSLARQMAQQQSMLRLAQMELFTAFRPFILARATVVELNGPAERVTAGQQSQLVVKATIGVSQQRFSEAAALLSQTLQKYATHSEPVRCSIELSTDPVMPPSVVANSVGYTVDQSCEQRLAPSSHDSLSVWLQTDYNSSSVQRFPIMLILLG